MQSLNHYFQPLSSFGNDEWILKHQIFAMRVLSFFLGLGVLPFAWFRLAQGNHIVGVSQLLFGIFLLYGFWRLRRDKHFYKPYSIAFLLLFFLYTAIVFFYVPQNHLNILWIISAPILIFFFLNKKGGVVMFVLVALFFLYLILSEYPYTLAEYITLIGAFLTTTFIMYVYEQVKVSEMQRMLSYSARLQEEVDKQTKRLQTLNNQLEARVEEEVQKQIEQEQMLLRQCRMASMGEMLAAIAHQWRQPLMNINAVLLNIDRIADSEEIDRAYLRSKIDEIATLTTHMSQTIEDFKNLFKLKQQKSQFLLDELVAEVLLLLKNNLRNIEVDTSACRSVAFEGYKSELTQVLIVLFSNAVEIFHTRNIRQPQIKVAILEQVHNVEITVEDNAGGITNDVMEKIFDPYFTTKAQSGGTGLGLYIAKIIVEHNLGGTIGVENSTQGARFRIALPKE